jgi:hypothetical protein
MIVMVIVVCSLWPVFALIAVDWAPGPFRGLLTKWIMRQMLRFPKWILGLSKQHKELTTLASSQEDKEIEVIIQELDKELAERNWR